MRRRSSYCLRSWKSCARKSWSTCSKERCGKMWKGTLQGTNPYPTWGKGKSSTQKCRLVGDMLVPKRASILGKMSVSNYFGKDLFILVDVVPYALASQHLKLLWELFLALHQSNKHHPIQSLRTSNLMTSTEAIWRATRAQKTPTSPACRVRGRKRLYKGVQYSTDDSGQYYRNWVSIRTKLISTSFIITSKSKFKAFFFENDRKEAINTINNI